MEMFEGKSQQRKRPPLVPCRQTETDASEGSFRSSARVYPALGSLSPTLPKSRAGVSFPRENSPSNGWRSCSSRFLPLGSYRERCVRPRCKHDGNSTSRSVQRTPAYSRTSLRWHVSSTRYSGKICPSAVFSVEKYSPITVFSYHFQD